MTIFISAIKIIFLLGFLIGIHETGHFLVAKKCKVKVNEFAIGFGPTIWQKQGKETKYALRLIPLGGYVNMEGESEHSDAEGSFTNASIPKRVAIVVAGATVNIVFALVVYFILSTTATNNVSNVVDELIPNYAAEQAGIHENDKILKLNGKKVTTVSDINEYLTKSNGEEVNLTIEREGNKQDIKMIPTEVKYKATGIYLYDTNRNSTKIAGIVKDSPAEKQGLQTGDEIISINGEIVEDNPEKLISIITENEYETLDLKLKRAGKEENINLIPKDESSYYLGVKFKIADVNVANNLYYASINTGEFMVSILDNLKQLFTGKVSTNQLVGPVGISDMISRTNGFKEFVYMLALISMSLGVTNLLPFPPLDGGKLVFLIIEAIRKKRLSEEFEIRVQLLGFTLLILLSVYITYNDILRIF